MTDQGIGRLYVLFCIIVFNVYSPEVYSQQQAVAVQWGELKENPRFGFNARIRSDHQEPFCEQPELSPTTFDWNNAALCDKISDFKPGLLRFPGGTPANYWIWEDEVQQVYNAAGEVELLTLCEGSLIGRNYSAQIGCSGMAATLDYESLSSIYSSTTVTLASYRSAILELRQDGIDLDELFVLGIFDPRYYVGSPQLEAETAGQSTTEKRLLMKQNGVQRAEAQLDKILYEYCGDCTSYPGEFSFELGNELHLRRYGKFLPSTACFYTDICEDCLPDVDFYADQCESIIPMIRQRFPNAKVAVNGSRDLGGEPWNQVIIDRFGQGAFAADAAMMHFYPKSTNPDSLNMELCQAVESAVDIEDILH
ncbi:MAG: hypothetical protein HKN79_08595, partial [Flavobacteriales bacterium]|nr:hypothetical protein [Flavobacteriales bacterium]